MTLIVTQDLLEGLLKGIMNSSQLKSQKKSNRPCPSTHDTHNLLHRHPVRIATYTLCLPDSTLRPDTQTSLGYTPSKNARIVYDNRGFFIVTTIADEQRRTIQQEVITHKQRTSRKKLEQDIRAETHNLEYIDKKFMEKNNLPLLLRTYKKTFWVPPRGLTMDELIDSLSIPEHQHELDRTEHNQYDSVNDRYRVTQYLNLTNQGLGIHTTYASSAPDSLFSLDYLTISVFAPPDYRQ